MPKRKSKYPRIRDKSLGQSFNPENFMKELDAERAKASNGLIKNFTLARAIRDTKGIVDVIPNPNNASRIMGMLLIDYFITDRRKIPYEDLSRVLEMAGEFNEIEAKPAIDLKELQGGTSQVHLKLPGIEKVIGRDYREFKYGSYLGDVDIPGLDPMTEDGIVDLGTYRGPNIAKRAVESYEESLPEILVIDKPKVIVLD